MVDLTDPDLLEVARRVVWFKPPHETLRNEVFFLNHAMIYGDAQDVSTIRRCYDDESLRDALRNAHPGIFDPRSWSYWHTVLGMLPVPPRPVRRLPGVQDAGQAALSWPESGQRAPPRDSATCA